MKNLIFLLFLLGLTACNETETAFTTQCEGVPAVEIGTGTVYDQIETDGSGTEIGYFISDDGTYRYYKAKCYDYYFALDNTLEVKESAGMYYSDNQCTQLIGEVFDYPLHFVRDVYVFQFEGSLYEYHLSGVLRNLTNVYRKTSGGVCTSVASVNNVREARAFSQSLF